MSFQVKFEALKKTKEGSKYSDTIGKLGANCTHSTAKTSEH